jgi:hypothetical protein
LVSCCRSSGRLKAQGPTIPLLPREVVEGFIQAATDHLDYLPGEVIVKFKPGVNVRGNSVR